MLSVETNKEITEFKRDFMGGFGFKESVAILGGVIIGVVIMLVLIFATGIPIFIAPYIAMPFIAIPIISAFYNKDGMGFLKHRKKVKEFNKTKACIYVSTENIEKYNRCLLEQEKQLKAKSDDAFARTLKIIIVIGIIAAIAIIGGIATLLIIKFK